MTATLPPARYRRGAVWVLVAVMTLFTVVLSACGVSVESQLEYRQDGSGQRILQVEIPDEVFDETDPNQRQVIEDSIETHRPDPLIFDGIAHNPGTSAVAEFRLDFASLDDYQGQVNQLLHASDYAGSTEIEAEISHGTLTDTWDINEPFTVADLLGWLPAGLEADGVVTGSQRQQLADGLQNGATNELVIDGEQYASEDDQRLQVSGEESFGYDRVEVDLTVTESGPIVGEIRLHGGSGEKPATSDALSSSTKRPSGSPWTGSLMCISNTATTSYVSPPRTCRPPVNSWQSSWVTPNWVCRSATRQWMTTIPNSP